MESLEKIAFFFQNVLDISTNILGHTAAHFVICSAVFLILISGLELTKRMLEARMQVIFSKRKDLLDTRFLTVLKRVSSWYLPILALTLTFKILNISNNLSSFISYLLLVVTVNEVIKAALILIEMIFDKSIPANDKTVVGGAMLIIKIALWTLGILIILSNLGFNVSALIASMGIGGIAIALAAQNILADLFASFTIYFDKPFQIGDLICVDSYKGTVTKIGLKTTRIQTVRGEEVIIGNKHLTESNIQNYKKMSSRRTTLNICLSNVISNQKLQELPKLLKEAIESQSPFIQFVSANFLTFGDYGLNFEIVYLSQSNETFGFDSLQHKANLAIKALCEREDIKIIFRSA